MPKRPSYVGPKKVQVTLQQFGDPVEITFPTSIAYHKFINLLTKKPDEENLQIWDGVNRIDFDMTHVDAVIFPQSELVLRKASRQFIAINIFFKKGRRYKIITTGENRLRIAYKQLEQKIGRTPEENAFIEIPQEENKSAFIRHDDVIVGLYSNEVGTA